MERSVTVSRSFSVASASSACRRSRALASNSSFAFLSNSPDSRNSPLAPSAADRARTCVQAMPNRSNEKVKPPNKAIQARCLFESSSKAGKVEKYIVQIRPNPSTTTDFDQRRACAGWTAARVPSPSNNRLSAEGLLPSKTSMSMSRLVCAPRMLSPSSRAINEAKTKPRVARFRSCSPSGFTPLRYTGR